MQDDKRTRAVFAGTMYGVAEDFGGTLSDNNLAVRFKALQDYSIDQITQAGTWLLKNRTEKFPAVPTTKEFIDVIENLAGRLNSKTAAQIECDKVLKKLKTYGREAMPLFHDEKTKYLMTHRWTFEKLGMMKDEDLKWFRKDFVEAYQDMGATIPVMIEGPKSNMVDFKKMAEKSVRRIEAL